MTEQDATTTSKPRGTRKVRTGVVVSDKMDKTVVVEVEDIRQHRLYQKTIRRTTRLKAHDEQNTAVERNTRKVREGLVVSDKMDKTVVVKVEDRVKHALYGKVIRRTSNLKAHDEQNTCGVGDRVLLMETRPLSATKRWRVVEILEKAK